MGQNLPTLFFYGHLDDFSQLKNGYLPLLDDLALLQPYLQYERWHQGRTQPVTEQEFQQELMLEYQRLPENIRALLTWADFQAQSEKLADQIRQRVIAKRGQGQVGYDLRRIQQAYYQRLFSSATSYYGWTQLAQQQGFCLGIRQPSSVLSATSGKPLVVKPVQYGGSHLLHASADNPVPGLFCDDEENKALSEWRVALPKTSLDQPRLKWAKGDLHSLYLSVMAADETWQQVRQLLRHDQRFRSVQLFEVFPDAQRWRLSARPVPL